MNFFPRGLGGMPLDPIDFRVFPSDQFPCQYSHQINQVVGVGACCIVCVCVCVCVLLGVCVFVGGGGVTCKKQGKHFTDRVF